MCLVRRRRQLVLMPIAATGRIDFVNVCIYWVEKDGCPPGSPSITFHFVFSLLNQVLVEESLNFVVTQRDCFNLKQISLQISLPGQLYSMCVSS